MKKILIITFIILLILISGCGITKHKEGVKLEEVVIMNPKTTQIKLLTQYGEALCAIAIYGEEFDLEWGFQDFPWKINLSLVYAGFYEEKTKRLRLTTYVSPLQPTEEKGTPIVQYVDGPLIWKGKIFLGKQKLKTKFKVIGGEQTSFLVFISEPYNTQFPDVFKMDKYSPKVYLGATREDATKHCYKDFCRIYIAEKECPPPEKCSQEKYQEFLDACTKAKYTAQ